MRVGVWRCTPSALPLGKTRYPFSRRLGFDPQTVQPVASRYTDWAILAHAEIMSCVFFFLISNFAALVVKVFSYEKCRHQQCWYLCLLALIIICIVMFLPPLIFGVLLLSISLSPLPCQEVHTNFSTAHSWIPSALVTSCECDQSFLCLRI